MARPASKPRPLSSDQSRGRFDRPLPEQTPVVFGQIGVRKLSRHPLDRAVPGEIVAVPPLPGVNSAKRNKRHESALTGAGPADGAEAPRPVAGSTADTAPHFENVPVEYLLIAHRGAIVALGRSPQGRFGPSKNPAERQGLIPPAPIEGSGAMPQHRKPKYSRAVLALMSAGISVRELGRELGCHHSNITRMLSGRQPLRSEVLDSIAELGGRDLAEEVSTAVAGQVASAEKVETL